MRTQRSSVNVLRRGEENEHQRTDRRRLILGAKSDLETLMNVPTTFLHLLHDVIDVVIVLQLKFFIRNQVPIQRFDQPNGRIVLQEIDQAVVANADQPNVNVAGGKKTNQIERQQIDQRTQKKGFARKSSTGDQTKRSEIDRG